MDAAKQLFETIKKRGMTIINDWVHDGCREDLHLDFKRKSRASSPKLMDDDRRNYSKALSGFANSDGGVIIWGIGAPGSGPNERTKHPIQNVNSFAEHLDSYISRLVSPSVRGSVNHVIYENGSESDGYVVSYIPKSLNPPHRAESEGLKQYYVRYGESFKITEHYELEFMFGKRYVPVLNVFWGVSLEGSETKGRNTYYKCRLNIGVTNQGRAIAKYVCFKLRYNLKERYRLTSDRNSGLIHYSHPERASKENYEKISARALPGMVVYPGDHQSFFSFCLKVSEKDLQFSKIPKFEMRYDLFAEDCENKIKLHYKISSKKIAEKISKVIKKKLQEETIS